MRLENERKEQAVLQAAIKAAQCPDPTGTYNVLVGNGLSASSRSKYFSFVEKYFYGFAEAAIRPVFTSSIVRSFWLASLCSTIRSNEPSSRRRIRP